MQRETYYSLLSKTPLKKLFLLMKKANDLIVNYVELWNTSATC